MGIASRWVRTAPWPSTVTVVEDGKSRLLTSSTLGINLRIEPQVDIFGGLSRSALFERDLGVDLTDQTGRLATRTGVAGRGSASLM